MNSPFEYGMNLACNKDGVLVGNTDNLKRFGIEIEKDLEKLKPCPFCGNEKIKIESVTKRTDFSRLNGLNESKYYVRCNKCFARGGVSSGYTRDARYKLTSNGSELLKMPNEIKKIAIEMWNRRV